MKKLLATMTILAFLHSELKAQDNGGYWLPIKEKQILLSGKRQIIPQKYLTFELKDENLKTRLFAAPNENRARINESACIIVLPAPDGSYQRFRVVESPIMEEGLATAFPNIKSFSVKGIDDPYAAGKLDWNEFGFHGMILSINGDFFIDPYCVNNLNDYIVYYTTDFKKQASDILPEVGLITSTENPHQQKKNAQGSNVKMAQASICVGAQLKTYRLAVACTGEYAVAATGMASPSVSQVLAKIVTTINRVTGVYEKELSIRLKLVATETMVIFTTANSDPFSGNNNAITLINESQSVITNTIGTANYDVGHTFSTGAGGLANLGCVCLSGSKAKGITGSASPVGDPYDIDYVSHEMGHQFGANHTFNAITSSCGSNRYGPTAMEPGGGVTIMSYAGICGANDILANSLPYFHAISYDEIVNFAHSGAGNSCAVTTTTGNQPPSVTGSAVYTVPKSTAFSLTGSAIDPDGDLLSYSWEEIDAGAGGGGNWNSGSRPYFRSYAPVSTAKRLFPSFAVAQNGNYTGVMGEFVPPTAQTLNFRLTARDNKANGGGVCYANSSVIVDAAGPLKITYPDSPLISWVTGSQQTITWDVNFTNNAPISCDTVKIWISYNGGNTFTLITGSSPNDGAELITVPTVTSSIFTCRIRIEAKGNVFYDISNNNFVISTEADVAVKTISKNNPVGLSVWPNPLTEQINFAVGNLDASASTTLVLVDLTGKILIQKTYQNHHEIKDTIDVSDLSRGVYFLKINHNGKQSAQRLIKE